MVGRTVLWSYHNKGILISFWLSHASKTSTYGYDEQGRITSLIDCNGHEVIVVSGETADLDTFHYQFIETTIKNINDLKEEGVPAENITWMVVEAGYKPKDLVNFAATADKLGINYVGISNKEQMIDTPNHLHLQRKRPAHHTDRPRRRHNLRLRPPKPPDRRDPGRTTPEKIHLRCPGQPHRQRRLHRPAPPP